MADGGGDSGFVHVLRRLAGEHETVEVELLGNASTKEGRLVGATSAYVTLVTGEHCGDGSDGSNHLLVFYIPVHKIVAIAER